MERLLHRGQKTLALAELVTCASIRMLGLLLSILHGRLDILVIGACSNYPI
jgi:hypothetical protein